MSKNIFYIHSIFSGRVQGVGLRSEVKSIAKSYELTGLVRNLNDGRVEIWAEGEELEVKNFIAEIVDELDIYIKKMEKKSGIGPRKFNKFSIQ